MQSEERDDGVTGGPVLPLRDWNAEASAKLPGSPSLEVPSSDDSEMPSDLRDATAQVLVALADAQIFGVDDAIGLANSDVGVGFWLGESILAGDASEQAVRYAAHLVGVKYRRQASGRLGSEAIARIARYANAGIRKEVTRDRKPCVRITRSDDGAFQATIVNSYTYELRGIRYRNLTAAESGRSQSAIAALQFETADDARAFVFNVQTKRGATVRYGNAAAAEYFAEHPPAPKRATLGVTQEGPWRLALSFPYDERFVGAVRSIPGRRFNPDSKEWSIPTDQANVAWAAFAPFEQSLSLDALKTHLTELEAAIMQEASKPRPVSCRLTGKGNTARVVLGFEYNAGIVGVIRDQHGRSFDPTTKTWSLPASGLQRFIEEAQQYNLFDGYDTTELLATQERVTNEANAERASVLAMLERDRALADAAVPTPPSALVGLRPYQCDGVAFLTASQAALRHKVNSTVAEMRERGLAAPYVTEKQPLGALLRDDMGLGKTAQTIRATMVLLEQSNEKALIVAPASVKLNWEREIHKFGGDNQRVQVLDGKASIDDTARWLVVNYDIIDRYHDALLEKSIGVVVFDEAHKIKNPKAKRTKYSIGYEGKSARGLGSDEPSVRGVASAASKKVILLTGTPIFNRPRDLFTLLRAIGHPVAANKREFEEHFCDGHLIDTPNGRAWDASGATDLPFLREVAAPLSLGRMKSQVLTDLPPKKFQVLPLDVPLAQYQAVLGERAKIRKEKQAQGSWDAMSRLAELTAARMATARAKAPATAEYVADSASTTNKMIVFSMSTEILDLIESALDGTVEGKVVRVDGTRSQKQRMAAVDAFQDDPDTVVLLGQTQAAGEGINLTAVSTIVFNDIGYIPGEVRQAIDRGYRIGQTKNLLVVFMAAANTLDEQQLDQMMEKITVHQQFEGTTQESQELLDTMGRALEVATTPRRPGVVY